MSIAPIIPICSRTCPAVGFLMGCVLLMSPVMAQPTSSVATHLGDDAVTQQRLVAPVTPPETVDLAAPSLNYGAEPEVPALPVAKEGWGAGEGGLSPSSPQMNTPLNPVVVADPYEQRMEGMRLSTVLSKRPVLATDPLDARASARVETEQGEVPKRWLIDPADATLRQTVLRWSDSIGWQMVWEADMDFAIDARVELHTNFKNALEVVMLSLADSAYPLQVSLNRDARIVRVQRYMEQRTR